MRARWGDEGFYRLNTGFEGRVGRGVVLCFTRFAGEELGYCELGWKGWKTFYSPWMDFPGDVLCCRRHDIAVSGIVCCYRGVREIYLFSEESFGAMINHQSAPASFTPLDFVLSGQYQWPPKRLPLCLYVPLQIPILTL